MQQLVNMSLKLNELTIKNNGFQNGNFQLSPAITRRITDLNENSFSIQLILTITNKEEEPFPFDILVNLGGTFEISNIPAEDREYFKKIQAPVIMFPYLRSILTTVTANTFMPPIILPVIDVKSLFPEDER